jgi:hypothetical protein
MPETPVRLHVPPACSNCGATASVHIQHTIKGESVILEWHCEVCGLEWPVRRKDEQRLGSGSSLTTSAMSRHTSSVQAAGAGSHKPKSRRRRPWHDRRIASMFTLRAQSVSPHHDGVAHHTSLRSRRTMMTRANSLHVREAGSLISLPVTHDHDPRKHPRTGATVMTAVVGYGGRTRRN